MATNPAGLTIIDTLVSDLQANETVKEKKANTVTAAVGSIATLLATGVAAWIENGTGLPSWLPYLAVFLGLIGTTYSVSKTKNGVTQSLADKLHDEIAKKIDENHFHDTELPTVNRYAVTEPRHYAPEVEDEKAAQRAAEILRADVDNILFGDSGLPH